MSAATALRGDLCPSWCGGEHGVQRGHYDAGGKHVIHPDDEGVLHHSPAVDLWYPLYGGDGDRHPDAIEFRIEGKRHDHGEDWPDVITALSISPGFLASVELQVQDARRLGAALLQACDLAEVTELEVASEFGGSGAVPRAESRSKA